MIIESIDLQNYRNYESLHLDLGPGIHIFYGDNAQGKTNLLEAMYLVCTYKSYRGAKDKELIRFQNEEAHIRLFATKKESKYRIDMHLKAGKAKGLAVNGVVVKKVKDFLGTLNAVIFSPEDLSIVKEGPENRRKFIDTELCLLNKIYINAFQQYKKALEQRNQLLKDIYNNPSLEETLDVWDQTLVKYGKELISYRRQFVEELKPILFEMHQKLTGGKEMLNLGYVPSVNEEDFQKELKKARSRDKSAKTTTVGPHRDDLSFLISVSDGSRPEIDARVFGSQGQQRTSALSLKMAEIEYVKRKTQDTPILFLDDVLSELDANRQSFLLENIKDVQTFITCTGLDDFVKHQFHINSVYRVTNGVISNGE